MTATHVDLQLDLSPLSQPDYTPEATLAERYVEWAAVNQHVIDAVEALAIQWFAAGNNRVSMRQLWERLRWESGVRSTTGPWKLNNDWPPFIARELVRRHPSWAEAINMRQSAADEVA